MPTAPPTAAPLSVVLTSNLRLRGGPPELRTALMEALELSNPKWVENERMGRWNRGVPRTLKFYDKVGADGLWIPRGYLRQLILLCRRMGVDHRIEDRRRSLPPVEFAFSGELRAFQAEAVEQMAARDFGTLSSPTGSGKTVMALGLVARRRQPTVVVVHTKDLAAQWVERIGAFLSVPAAECGMIAGGRARIGERITVALVQSLYKCADEVSARTGFLVVDECHRCPSRTFTEAVTGFDSRYMLGLSATPYRRDNLSRLIFWHLGDVHHEVARDDLVRSGAVLAADIVTRATAFRSYSDPLTEYSRMLSELTGDTERNLLIARDVAAEAAGGGGISLVLSDRKAHCENLKTLLLHRFKTPSELMTGDLPPQGTAGGGRTAERGRGAGRHRDRATHRRGLRLPQPLLALPCHPHPLQRPRAAVPRARAAARARQRASPGFRLCRRRSRNPGESGRGAPAGVYPGGHAPAVKNGVADRIRRCAAFWDRSHTGPYAAHPKRPRTLADGPLRRFSSECHSDICSISPCIPDYKPVCLSSADL